MTPTETMFGLLGEEEDNIHSKEEYLVCISWELFWY